MRRRDEYERFNARKTVSPFKMSQSLLPPSLPPSQLYTDEARRDATRIRIYNMVLSQIYNKIKAVARVPGNQKF